MNVEQKVVVLVTLKFSEHDTSLKHCARFRELGLAAYGNTREEALTKLRHMFASSVYAHREVGTLVGWLDRTGLTWAWEDEYHGPLPAEDAVEQENAAPSISSNSDGRAMEELAMAA